MSAGDASDDIVSGGTVVVRTLRDEASRESVERALRQRVRELDALRRIAALLVEDGPLEARFDPLVAILAGATQYPESTTAACFHRGRFFASPGHTRTPWVLTATVPSPRGVTTLELAYHSPKPEAAFGPFLAEERTLLDVIADLVRTAIERRDAQVALRETLDRMDHAFSAARMGVWELEIGTRTTRWSSQLSQMTGLAGPPVGPLWSRADLASISRFMAMRQFEVPVNLAPSPSCIACTHQSCHRKLCRRLVPKSAIFSPSIRRSRSIFSQSRVIARA